MIRILPAFFLLLCCNVGHTQSWQALNDTLESAYQAGDYIKALDVAKKALSQAEREFTSTDKQYAEALYQLAYVHHTIGNFADAEKRYQQAADIRKTFANTDPLPYGIALKSLGELYGAMNKFPEAEPLLRRAITYIKQHTGEKNADYADALMTLGILYRRMYLFDQAEPIQLKATQIQKALVGEDSDQYAMFVSQLALLYDWMAFKAQSNELRKKSAGLYEKVLAIRYKTVGRTHPLYANTIKGLAVLYAAMREYDRADSLYREALSIYQENNLDQTTAYAAIASDYAHLCLETKNFTQAEKWLNDVLKIRKQKLGPFHANYIGSLNLLADVYYNTDRYRQAEKLWIEINHLHLRLIAYNFPTLTEAQRNEFYVVAQKYFEPFVSFACQTHGRTPTALAEAYNLQLVTKGLLLQSVYRMQRIATQLNDSARRQFKQWQLKKSSIATYYNQSPEQQKASVDSIACLEQEVEDIEKQLSAQSAPFDRLLTKSIHWIQIQQCLKKKEAAIEIVRFRKYKNSVPRAFTDTVYYAALIITPNVKTPQLVLLENGNALEGVHLRHYQHAMLEQATDMDSYRQFWQPIRQALTGIKTVYLSPDGVYNQINLQTLLNPESGKYVLQEIDLRLLTTTRDLLLPAADRSNRSIALFGFPDYQATVAVTSSSNPNEPAYESIQLERSEKFVPLPSTKIEAENISKMTKAKGWKTRLFLAGHASEENLKSVSSPNVLHLATHGYFQSDVVDSVTNPLLRSGLLFAGARDTTRIAAAKKEDGILTAYEATGLSLEGTQLVVLSACETGVGEIRNGEGVYGLQRAFTVAGAQSVMISLWKINDQVTQRFMTLFYQNWLRGLPPHQALRRTQSKIRRQAMLTHPYYWGSFVLTGR